MLSAGLNPPGRLPGEVGSSMKKEKEESKTHSYRKEKEYLEKKKEATSGEPWKLGLRNET